MSAPSSVVELVDRFGRNLESYRSGSYKETQVRIEFIDPLFKALGWDLDNEAGYAEAYKDVVHEASIRVKGGTDDGRLKAPDYSFRVGGTRRFFVEAKKPSVDIKGAPAPAFQVRRYGWSDPDVPLSILTDFEEFAVYDCRIKPEKGDRSSKARVNYYTYEEYPEKWDEIASVFSKEAVLKGSFDKYAASERKRGTAEPGDEFLKQIEGWREALAGDLARRNPDLTQRQLNAAVQRTIDRIVFLRIAEERGIEGLGELKEAVRGKGAYSRLVTLFREADAKYNSGLFHFGSEKGRAGTVDTLTLGLEVGDKVLKEIVGGLYYPECPYAFDVLPTDILGQVYERFLGKVIRLTDKHRAVVEDKPEVKKAGGVFYTPTYIVDRIVEGALSPLLDGKTPRTAEEVKVVDPACGSGSFLLGAYDFLLSWYLDRYTEGAPEKWAKGKEPRIFQNASGAWQLTIGEKKRVLLAHLFGVDIDPQAVEVTKLSLLLRVLEGETAQTTGQQALFKERVLPELSSNIKCGNSLVGPDFFDGKPFDLFNEDAHYRINAFDWGGKDGFPGIMKRGGFDAVIGNPPYVRIQHMREWASPETDYIGTTYSSASGSYDLYVPFIERGLEILRNSGRLGYIVQHRFFKKKYGAPLRRLIAEGRHLSHVTHFGTEKVFKGATTYTALVFLSKSPAKEFVFEEVDDLNEWRSSKVTSASGTLPATEVVPEDWNFVVREGGDLFRRLRDENHSLGDVARVFVGVQTSADDVFILDKLEGTGGLLRLRSEALESTVDVEPDLFMPVLSGEDVNDYTPLGDRQYILFPYVVNGLKSDLIPFSEIEQNQPRTAAYLLENKTRLEGRERGKFKGDGWHRFGRNQNISRQDKAKVCVPRLVDPLVASYDPSGGYCLDNVDVNGVVWKPPYDRHSDLYLLALLNSDVCRWYLQFVSEPYQGGYLSANKQYLEPLAFRVIDFENDEEVRVHDRVVDLVTELLSLRQSLEAGLHDHGVTIAKRRAEGVEKEINQLVFSLYGLSDTERATVSPA